MLDDQPVAARGRTNLRRGRAIGTIAGGLVPLNGAKIRAQALKALKRAEESFNAADQLLKEFETHDVRAFERWKYERLGPLFADQARVGQALNEAEYHMAMAEEESWRTGQPLWRAFQSWQEKEERRRLHPEPPEPEPTADDPAANFEAFKRAFRDSPLGAMAEELGVDLDDLPFEDLREEFESPRQRRPGHPLPAKPQIKPDVRALYRQLCRLLHPDAAGDLSPERREIWHQVQEAYAARDATRLDTLLARVEQGGGHDGFPRTVAALRAMAQHFRRAQNKLRGVMADARRHPAWQFRSRRADYLTHLERLFRRDMTEHLNRMEQRLAQIRSALQPRVKKRKSPPHETQGTFHF